jgi:hypothetical protein
MAAVWACKANLRWERFAVAALLQGGLSRPSAQAESLGYSSLLKAA